jgi:hypothetical protein
MSKPSCLNLSCQARFAKEGWCVRVHGSQQTYYLQKTASVLLPNSGICEGQEYRAKLEEADGGWVGIGWKGMAIYLRTIGPKEYVRVELSLEDAADLVRRMQEPEAT